MAADGTAESKNLRLRPGTTGPRVVLVHDWLTGNRGGEKCLAAAARRYPHAKLYTILYQKETVPAEIARLGITPSWLDRLPLWPRYYRYLLPLMPLATGWRLPECDVVVSFSHCVAKSVTPPPGVPHVCYCFSPMRYAWQMETAYFGERPRGVVARLRGVVLARLRAWDRATANRVTHFVAISETVRGRIRECYGRDSRVVYPPVDTEFYTPSGVPREDFYLVVSALAPYKRFDLAIESCERLGRRLVVIGTGTEFAKLQAMPRRFTTLLGHQPDGVVRDHLRRAAALLFPGEEDFGIAPVEAMACGTPVICYTRGGVGETVIDGVCGVHFAEQSAESLTAAIQAFESRRGTFDPARIRRRAEEFSRGRYERELFALVESVAAGKISPASHPESA